MSRRRRKILLMAAAVLLAAVLGSCFYLHQTRVPREVRGLLAARRPPSTLDKWLSKLGLARKGLDQDEIAKKLAAIGPPAIPYLIDAFANTDGNVRLVAIRALARIGPEVASPTIRALGDSNPQVRAGAASTLGQILPRPDQTVPVLIAALGDKDVIVRRQAVVSLGSCGPEAREAVPQLIKALSDPDFITYICAAQALGRVGPEAKAATIDLVKKMMHPQRGMQYESLDALWHICGRETEVLCQELRKLMDDKDPQVRAGATWGLREARQYYVPPVTGLDQK